MLRSLFRAPVRPTALPHISSISATELKDRLDSGDSIALIDVRSNMEFKFDSHIEGARLMPLNVLPQRMSELSKDDTIVIVCRSGNRSMAACEYLAGAGFTKVLNLTGGMISWQRLNK